MKINKNLIIALLAVLLGTVACNFGNSESSSEDDSSIINSEEINPDKDWQDLYESQILANVIKGNVFTFDEEKPKPCPPDTGCPTGQLLQLMKEFELKYGIVSQVFFRTDKGKNIAFANIHASDKNTKLTEKDYDFQVFQTDYQGKGKLILETQDEKGKQETFKFDIELGNVQ